MEDRLENVAYAFHHKVCSWLVTYS